MGRQNFLELGSNGAAVPQPVAAPRNVAAWNALALQLIRTHGPYAPCAARSLAILHTCMYNAWAAYDDAARQTAHGFAVRLPRAERSAASRACAMGHAAYLALAGRFPAQRAAIDAHFLRLGLDPAPAGVLSPAGIGRIQATAMLDACRAEDAQVDAQAHIQVDVESWCMAARQASARAGHDDDRDVLLYFVLANALADADHGLAGAAAAEALRRFTGDAQWAGDRLGVVADNDGKRIGAQAFERARRHWQGKP